MKIRDVIKLIEADGWYLVTTQGSHRQYQHPMKSGRVTIAGHPNDDLAPGTCLALSHIWRFSRTWNTKSHMWRSVLRAYMATHGFFRTNAPDVAASEARR